jgi:transcriptional regulator with XRE-family HTH domain
MRADLMEELVTELEDQRNRLLGRHIRDLRLQAGLSTEQVADRMRDAGHHTWTAQTLSDIQRHGSRRPTAVSALEARDLAPILGVSLDHLLAAPGLPEPPSPPVTPGELTRTRRGPRALAVLERLEPTTAGCRRSRCGRNGTSGPASMRRCASRACRRWRCCGAASRSDCGRSSAHLVPRRGYWRSGPSPPVPDERHEDCLTARTGSRALRTCVATRCESSNRPRRLRRRQP